MIEVKMGWVSDNKKIRWIYRMGQVIAIVIYFECEI